MSTSLDFAVFVPSPLTTCIHYCILLSLDCKTFHYNYRYTYPHWHSAIFSISMCIWKFWPLCDSMFLLEMYLKCARAKNWMHLKYIDSILRSPTCVFITPVSNPFHPYVFTLLKLILLGLKYRIISNQQKS